MFKAAGADIAPLVVVTGASSGIGRATAHLLAIRGYRLVLIARGAVPLMQAASECAAAGAAAAETVVLDVNDAERVEAAFGSIEMRSGPIDAVVHSAGVAGYGRFHEMPREVFEAVIGSNVFGAANVARSVLPAMRERNAGTLVLLGSVIGHIAVPRMTPYVVSKWAVRSLARQLQLDNRDCRGVRVCLVEPGSVDTPIYRQAATYMGHQGHPPPPVVTPDKVAQTVARVLDRPRKHVGVGPGNLVMKAGFTLAPKVYDALVGPLFSLVGTDPASVAATSGNVLEPNGRLNQVRGEQPGLTKTVLGRLARR